jgi:CubicO group peptidase (beta-lactamase class C family)
LLSLAAAPAPSVAQAPLGLPDSVVATIDRLFAPWAHSGSPGCAAGVYQDGRVAFSRGYGFANLTHDVPITPATKFTVGSVSKQFTAASIALLVRAGRLSLDDDVRKLVPELPPYASQIKVRHLVHHTSGTRDFWELVSLAGMRPDDGYRVDDMLQFAARQQGLNFAPGSAYRYSNTGYLLLGLIVQRVSGQTLRTFADSAIFRPLGMRETIYLDDHNELVPNRAIAYAPTRGGFRMSVWNNDLVGQGGIVTSLADLQKWDENFYNPKVGGPEFVALMRSLDPLNDGASNAYAFGLTVGTYRGQRLEQHTGATGGYRAAIYRFPDLHSSIAMLCNLSEVNTAVLSLRLADAVLATRLGAREVPWAIDSVPPPPPEATTISRDAVLGTYRSDELLGAEWVIAADSGGGIVVRRPRYPPMRFRATAANVFGASTELALESSGVLLNFDPAVRGRSPGFVVNGDRVSGVRFVRMAP